MRCLEQFERIVASKEVLLRCDNFTVVSYINREGGTKSPKLCYLAWDLLHWCRQRDVRLRAVHIAGVDNRLADLLSRTRLRHSEWKLNRSVVVQVFNLLFWPLMDLFASKDNNQLPTYCSWTPDPRAWAVDALSLDWDGLSAYAFPPIALIPAVLKKVGSSSCHVILIAPHWPRRTWFPQLLQLLWMDPYKLPDRFDLLSQRRGQIKHPNPEVFQLVAWPLSGNDYEQRGYRDKLQSSSLSQSGPPLTLSTEPDSRSLLSGVLDGRLIPMRHS